MGCHFAAPIVCNYLVLIGVLHFLEQCYAWVYWITPGGATADVLHGWVAT